MLFLCAGSEVWIKLGSTCRQQLKCCSVLATCKTKSTYFDFTTAGDWDCVVAVERLPALHYSVDFILFSFGIMGFIVEL